MIRLPLHLCCRHVTTERQTRSNLIGECSKCGRRATRHSQTHLGWKMCQHSTYARFANTLFLLLRFQSSSWSIACGIADGVFQSVLPGAIWRRAQSLHGHRVERSAHLFETCRHRAKFESQIAIERGLCRFHRKTRYAGRLLRQASCRSGGSVFQLRHVMPTGDAWSCRRFEADRLQSWQGLRGRHRQLRSQRHGDAGCQRKTIISQLARRSCGGFRRALPHWPTTIDRCVEFEPPVFTT